MACCAQCEQAEREGLGLVAVDGGPSDLASLPWPWLVAGVAVALILRPKRAVSQGKKRRRLRLEYGFDGSSRRGARW